MTKLHLGCGNVHLPAPWINIDQRYQPGVDRLDNVGILQHWKAGSIEAIYACHVIGHFSRWEYKRVLARWHELLEEGGSLFLSTPNFAAIARAYIDGVPLERLMGALYASQDYPGNHRHFILDQQSAARALKEVGFSGVLFPETFKELLPGLDDCSMAKLDGKLLSLNIEAVK